MAKDIALEKKDLTKKYDDRVVVNGISFEIYKGNVLVY
jgi:ABC-type multidrug transport system ATPase subunit